MIKIPHQLTENTKLLHKIALIHNQKVLILQRSADSTSRPEKWDLAGGNSEWPDDDRHGHGVHREDVAREISEETGINIPAGEFNFSKLSYFDTYFDSKKQVFTVICGWRYDLTDYFDENSVKISDEHANFKWILISELDQFDFGGEKGQFIKNIIKGSIK